VNLSQARTRVRALANIRSVALLSDADIDEALNEFTAEMWDAYNWPQAIVRSSFPTVVAQAGYAWPSGARNVLDLRVGGRQLKPLSDLEFAEVDTAVAGEPERYWVNVSSPALVLWPSPAAVEVAKLTYKKGPALAASGNVAADFDGEYHMAWCYAAAVAVLRERAGNEQKVADYASRVARILGRMRKRYLHSSDWSVSPFNNGWVGP
jgi:hypothetical protein